MIMYLIIATAVGAATFYAAKKRRANNTTAAVAGMAIGAGSVATMMIASVVWPVAVIAGLPLAYLYGKSRGQSKALPPGHEL